MSQEEFKPGDVVRVVAVGVLRASCARRIVGRRAVVERVMPQIGCSAPTAVVRFEANSHSRGKDFELNMRPEWLAKETE